MKIKNIARQFPEENWSDWWEINSTDLSRIYGEEGKRDGELAYKVKSGKNTYIVCNFLPRYVPLDGEEVESARGMSLRTRLDLIVGELYNKNNWEGGSRVTSLIDLAAKNEHLKKLLSLQVGSMKETEKVTQDHPSVGEWVRFLSRALKDDVVDNSLSVEEKKAAIKFVNAEVERWQLIQKSRGFQSNPEKMITKDVNNNLRFVYSIQMVPEDERVLASIYSGVIGGSNAVLAIDEGRSDAIALDFAPSVYMGEREWETAFRAYNARSMHSKLWSAKATKTMPTAYPGMIVDVPENLKEHFNGGSKVAYKMSSYIKDTNEKYYVYSVFDENGKEVSNASVNKSVFDKLRLATNPKVVLPNGKRGVYKRCNRTNQGKVYQYVDEQGKTHGFEEDEHYKIIEENNNPNAEINPVSYSIRGHIDDLFEKFFVTNTPEKFIDKRPDTDKEIRALRDSVKANVLADYIPIWEDVVNELDEETKAVKIAVGMKTLLDGVSVQSNADEIEKLNQLERKSKERLYATVRGKAKNEMLVEHCESKWGVPSVAYSNYSNMSKYEYWKKEICNTGKTAADKENLLTEEIKNISPEITSKMPNVKEAVDHFTNGVMQDLTETASLMVGEKLNQFSKLSEAGNYFDSEYLTDYYKSKENLYSIHYSPSKPLPYISRKGIQLSYSNKTKNRDIVDLSKFITKINKDEISKSQKISVAKEKIKVTKDKDLSENGNQMLELLKEAHDNYDEDPLLYEDIATALRERAEGNIMNEEIDEIIGNISPDESIIILRKFTNRDKEKEKYIER